MIPLIEKKIMKKLRFINQLLNIDNKYVDDGSDFILFKKSEIIQIFNELNFSCKYLKGGGYLIERKYEKYTFQCDFVISRNTIGVYYILLKEGKLIDTRISNIHFLLNYLPYDNEMINVNFRLNSLSDLKSYINDHVILFNQFIDEYIKEITY